LLNQVIRVSFDPFVPAITPVVIFSGGRIAGVVHDYLLGQSGETIAWI
jgi:hypothetical protein